MVGSSLQGFVTAHLEGRRVVLEVSAKRQKEVELLDGCYVVVSDVPRWSGTSAP
jgi:uncharacterized protein YebE (UPF0316 family)